MNYIFHIFLIVHAFINQISASNSEYTSNRKGETFGERSAIHLLSHMSSKKIYLNAYLLDLGCCGSGEVSKTIAEELAPFGSTIIALDINDAAVQEARRKYPKTHYPNLDFIVRDVNTIAFSNTFDIIISISLFHLVQDPQKVSVSSFQALKQHGIAIIQVPIAFPDPLEKATTQIIAQERWKQYFQGFSRGWNGVSEQTFAKIFESQGFNIIRQVRFADHETIESVEKFKAFLTNWYPYLNVIPDNDKQTFLEDIVSSYLQFQPLLPDGNVPFIVERLEFELEKPKSIPCIKSTHCLLTPS